MKQSFRSNALHSLQEWVGFASWQGQEDSVPLRVDLASLCFFLCCPEPNRERLPDRLPTEPAADVEETIDESASMGEPPNDTVGAKNVREP